MNSNAIARLGKILNRWVSPVLSEHGFHREKDLYVCEGDDCIKLVVDVQRGRWNNASRCEFTMNCGVFIPAATSHYLGREVSKSIALTNCCIFSRLGMLHADHLDKWWILHPEKDEDSDDRLIGEELKQRLTQDVIPFFHRFSTLENCIDFLSTARSKGDKFISPQSDAIALCYAAGIANYAGRRGDAFLFLEKAKEIAKSSPIEESVNIAAEKLLA